MDMTRRAAAEFFGTFWLTFGGCGAAVLAGIFASDTGINIGIGLLGVSLAFGLTVLTMAYAVGHISGGHFNPAVTLGFGPASGAPPATCSLHRCAGDRRHCRRRSAVLDRLRQAGWVRGGFAANGYGSSAPASMHSHHAS